MDICFSEVGHTRQKKKRKKTQENLLSDSLILHHDGVNFNSAFPILT